MKVSLTPADIRDLKRGKGRRVSLGQLLRSDNFRDACADELRNHGLRVPAGGARRLTPFELAAFVCDLDRGDDESTVAQRYSVPKASIAAIYGRAKLDAMREASTRKSA